MQKSINAVAADVPLARSEILALNSTLYTMGLRGKSLSLGLKAVALGASAAGDAGKQMGMNLLMGSVMFGKGAGRAYDIMKSKFGAIVQQQMLALPTQIAKAKENWAALFRGINITPLLKGLDGMLSFMKQGTVQADAWSKIFETLFSPLFKGAEEGGNVIKTFLNKVTILALNSAIAWEDMGASFSLQKFGFKSTSDLLQRSVKFASGLAIAVLRTAQGAIWFGTTLEKTVSILGLVARSAWAVGAAIHSWTKKGEFNSKDWEDIGARMKGLGDFDTPRAGIQLIQGLVDGIKNATPYLEKAAADSGNKAKAAFDESQGIRSPAKKWIWSGRQMPLGGAIGINQTAPQLRSAAADVMGGSIRPTPSGGSTQNSYGGGVHIEGGVHIHGEVGQQTVTIPIAALNDWFAATLEGMCIRKGAPV